MLSPAHRLLSAPIEIYWGGWAATTTQLQQAGWEISAEQEIEYATLTLALRHRDFKVYALTERIPLDYFRHASSSIPPALRLRVRYMANNLQLNIVQSDGFEKFAPVDAYPQMVNRQAKSIEDFKIFATPLVRTEEIIVDPPRVEELLEQIKKMQAPGQAEVRERTRIRQARETGQPVERQKFHAQILSFARAA